ncbi:MAG TPA: O-antigen ligase family protein [Anaerolineales bacterium]|nr:O-antigen ligase family protein [Anaerolineales bacterium]
MESVRVTDNAALHEPWRLAGARMGFWLRLGLVVAAIFGSVFLAPGAAQGKPFSLVALALPLGILGLMALAKWPAAGLPLIVVASLLVPLSIGTGRQTGLNVTLLLVVFFIGLWIFDMVAARRELRLIESPTFRPLIWLMAVSVLALGFGQLDWLPAQRAPITAQLGGLALFLLSPGAFLLAAHRFQDLRSLQWAVWLFIGLGSIFVIGVSLPALRPIALQVYQRAAIDAMFWTWIVALAFGQAVVNRRLRLRWRILSGLVVAAAFYFAIMLRGSWTSGWLPALVAVLTIVGLRRPKWLLIGGAVVGAMLLIPGVASGIFLGGDNQYSLSTRFEAWRILLEIIKLNPILGVGPANYYGYTPLYDILGYWVNFNSHNNYIDIAAQTGLAGLSCFVWFAWAMARELWRFLSVVPEGFPRAYVYGAAGGLAGMLVAGMLGDWFIPFVYNVGLEGFRASSLAWLFLGSVVALQQMYPAPSVSPDGEAKSR